MSGCRKQKKKYKFHQPRRRRDMVTRMLVDLGISYTSSLGIERTLEFLRNKNIPEEVIHRVIKNT
jgi:hypothetical protein